MLCLVVNLPIPKRWFVAISLAIKDRLKSLFAFVLKRKFEPGSPFRGVSVKNLCFFALLDHLLQDMLSGKLSSVKSRQLTDLNSFSCRQLPFCHLAGQNGKYLPTTLSMTTRWTLDESQWEVSSPAVTSHHFCVRVTGWWYRVTWSNGFGLRWRPHLCTLTFFLFTKTLCIKVTTNDTDTTRNSTRLLAFGHLSLVPNRVSFRSHSPLCATMHLASSHFCSLLPIPAPFPPSVPTRSHSLHHHTLRRP